jgi:hydroxymethylbilane synthase
VSEKNKSAGICSLTDLPPSAVVGTSSLRRQAQIKRLRPDLTCLTVRGNLQTRLRKLDNPESFDSSDSVAPRFDALVLAAAGVKRLGWDERVTETLGTPSHDAAASASASSGPFPWGVGQGALAVEVRAGDKDLAEMINEAMGDVSTTLCCLAERAMLRGLLGGCQVPIAVSSEHLPDAHSVELHGWVASLDGSEVVESESTWRLRLPSSERDESQFLGYSLEPFAAGYLFALSSQQTRRAVLMGKALADDLVSKGAARLLGDRSELRPATFGCA